MNWGRFILAVIIGFAFYFGIEYAIWQYALMDYYDQTRSLWRPEADMMDFLPYCIVSRLLITAAIGLIYVKKCTGEGLYFGACYGILAGAIIGLAQFTFYSYLPIPMEIAIGWLVTGLIVGTGIGAIFGVVYKRT